MMKMFPYKLSGRVTTSTVIRAAFHCVIAFGLLEMWDIVFHSFLSPWWADKMENITAALIIVVTQFLIGTYNDPEVPPPPALMKRKD